MIRPSLLMLPLVAAAAGCASYEVDGLAGLSVVSADVPGGVEPFIDDDAGLRLAANGSRSLLTPGFVRGGGGNGLRGNVNLSASRYGGDDDSELLVVSPQVGPSFRLSGFGLFAEAGATAGAAYADLDSDAGSDDQFSYAARPYGRVGLVGDRLIFAVEGGYEVTGLDFDLRRAGEDYENFYVGAVLGLRITR